MPLDESLDQDVMELYNDLVQDDTNWMNANFRFTKKKSPQPGKNDGIKNDQRAFLRYGTGMVNYFVL